MDYAQRAESRRERAWTLLNVAFVRLLRQDYSSVRTLCADSLALRGDSLGSRECTAAALQLLAGEAVSTGAPERAMRLFGAAAAQWQACHSIFQFWSETMCERWETIARDQLGFAAEQAFSVGSNWDREDAVSYALGGGPDAETDHHRAPLSLHPAKG